MKKRQYGYTFIFLAIGFLLLMFPVFYRSAFNELPPEGFGISIVFQAFGLLVTGWGILYYGLEA